MEKKNIKEKIEMNIYNFLEENLVDIDEDEKKYLEIIINEILEKYSFILESQDELLNDESKFNNFIKLLENLNIPKE